MHSNYAINSTGFIVGKEFPIEFIVIKKDDQDEEEEVVMLERRTPNFVH